MVGALAATAPATVLGIAPGNPVALIASTRYGERVAKQPSVRQMAILTRAARSDPLYFQPFLAKAAQVALTGDHRRAIDLGRAAAARQPRSIATHLLLLQEYARTGNKQAAVAEVGSIVALNGETGRALNDTLRVLAADPQGAAIIAAAMRSNPSWRSTFVREASGPAERLAFQSLVATPRGVADRNEQGDRAGFLARLVASGDYQRAYLAWVNFLPASGAEEVAAIYDGDFKGLPGLPPFNWMLTTSDAATAERRNGSELPSGRSLDVNYFGRDAAVIAAQTLFVQPGSYRFTMNAMADAGGQFAGVLKWQLSCLPSGPVIPLATLTDFTGRSFTIRTAVTISATGCAAQQLTLAGEPGDVSTLIHAQFGTMRLVAQ